ncbi:MAG TPA: hypothetical protein VHK91_18325 [Flavisolibacter sp.]|jgi:DNA/RNA endonuclease YhcR with UshA esterase domain|nr:hypothetical protein [Flavisolibacter sp.]
MKALTLLLSMMLLTTMLHAQKEIKAEEAYQHEGDSVVLTGTVMGGRYLQNAVNGPTLLNLGAAYPNQLLTVVIYEQDRALFKEAPETFFMKKTVRVAGKIELYKGKPQIVIHDQKQLTVAGATEPAKN